MLGLLCFVTSFSVGIQSAGEVAPFVPIKAESVVVPGDMNNDGLLDKDDVNIMLEIANGYREASSAQLRADPNQDGSITVSDAMQILSTL